MHALVDRFDELTELEPDIAGPGAAHPESLDGSRCTLVGFLDGGLGGPDLQVQRFSQPMLRARLLPQPAWRVVGAAYNNVSNASSG